MVVCLLLLCVCGAVRAEEKAIVFVEMSSALHLREAPSAQSPSMGLYFTGTEVTCLSALSEDWVHVLMGAVSGYMKREYLRPQEDGAWIISEHLLGFVKASHAINMRSGPSAEYEHLGTIEPERSVAVLGETDNHWYYVRYEGKYGYVSAKLVELQERAEQQENEKDEVPIGVSRSAEWYFPEWEIEDYAQIDRAEAGSLGLVFLRSKERQDRHRLAFYVVWEDAYYSDQEILFMIEDGLPQGMGTLRFVRENEGTIIIGLAGHKDDKTNLSEMFFTWRDDAFHLGGYREASTDGWVICRGDALDFSGGTLQVALLTDMRYVDYEALPKTYAEAKESPAIVPATPLTAHPNRDVLTAQVRPMIEGRNHKVYMGPGENYPRSGNGKGTVSTNQWVQVFGKYNGWLMVQYHIEGTHYRIGWMKEPALKKGASAPDLPFGSGTPQEILEDCVLTDDPMGSGSAVCELRQGTTVRHLANLGDDWDYIEVKVDGKTYWGFVPSDCMSHG